MNFIFDVGNVLLNYKPEEFLSSLINNPVNEEKLNNLIFRSKEWIMLDEGTITKKEAQSIFISKAPDLEDLIIKTMKNIPSMLTAKEETADYLPKIKEAGHNLYYLSNFHKWLTGHILKENPFFEYFDGGVFSCDVNLIKPFPEIYNYLINKYNLIPNECIFFDDVKANIDGANNIGINGVLFSDAKQIEGFI